MNNSKRESILRSFDIHCLNQQIYQVPFTSYFGKRLGPDGLVFRKISISLYTPKGFKGPSLPELAPTESILKEYKVYHNKQRYYQRYCAEVLNNLDPKVEYMRIMQLSQNAFPVLCCYEKAGEFCHRHIVSDWLNFYGIHSEELQ